jgi:o-succinylbenzoate synthase
MKLIRLSWQGFCVPFRKPYVAANTRSTMRYGLLVFLFSDVGLVGVGDASPAGTGSYKEIETIAAQLRILGPRVLERGLESPEPSGLPQDQQPYTTTRFGIETATLDLKAKASMCSVADLLGGSQKSLPVNALIATEIPKQAAIEAKAALAQGFTSLKLKVGMGSLYLDEDLVASVRQEVGPKIKLRIDPNQGWDVDQAIAAINRLAGYDLEYVEQPIHAEDLLGLREIRRAVSVPIAADEALCSTDDLHKMIGLDAVDLFILKPARLGSARNALDMIRISSEAKKPVVITSSLDSGVGVAASVHLASTLSSHPFAHGLCTGLLLENDLLSSPLKLSQGRLSTPDGHGLGVTVNTAALDEHSIAVYGSVNI